jgi:hypothetical protein
MDGMIFHFCDIPHLLVDGNEKGKTKTKQKNERTIPIYGG